MNLEDHAGDVVRKARLGAGIQAESAAAALNVSPTALATLEETGVIPVEADLQSLGGLIGLDGAKLKRIAQGWLPSAVDLSLWRELRQITTTQGMAVNCYLVWDEVSREAALFDTGWSAEPILQLLEENGLQLRHLFITHTHEDHIAAMGALREKFPKLHLHTNAKSAPPQHRNRANDFLQLGSLRITNRDTPGHAEDGVTYIVGNWPDDAPHVAIVGDAIFAGSIGGAKEAMPLAREKIRAQIFSLPPETLLCCGHGPVTTIAEEKANNPFF